MPSHWSTLIFLLVLVNQITFLARHGRVWTRSWLMPLTATMNLTLPWTLYCLKMPWLICKSFLNALPVLLRSLQNPLTFPFTKICQIMSASSCLSVICLFRGRLTPTILATVIFTHPFWDFFSPLWIGLGRFSVFKWENLARVDPCYVQARSHSGGLRQLSYEQDLKIYWLWKYTWHLSWPSRPTSYAHFLS